MSSKRLFLVISALICSIAPVEQTAANLPPGAPLENPNPARDCLGPALARSRRHIALQGETVESIARQYNVPTAALTGINPMLRGGKVAAGSAIVIPPYDGRLVEVPAGWNWQKLAQVYQVPADLLFEANGCRSLGQTVFVPKVNHQAGKQTRYAHLRDIAVKVGQKVRSAEVLGSVGMTGKRDIPQAHLHCKLPSTDLSTDTVWAFNSPETILHIAKQSRTFGLIY
jgi:LysM repeat protein